MEKLTRIQVFDRVKKELIVAMKKFPSFNSTHEGYAVILEELDELWSEIKTNNPFVFTPNMEREAIQIAAMAIRFILDRQNGTLAAS